MSLLKTHSIQSENELEIEAISKAIFRPSQFARFHEAGAFDIKADVTSIRSMTLWQICSRSGYRAQYGCPKHQHVEIHFIEKGSYDFESADERIEASAQTAVLIKDTRKVTLVASPGSRKLSMLMPFDQLARHINRSQGGAGRGLSAFHSHTGANVTGMDIIHRTATHLLHGLDPNGLSADSTGAPELIHDALIMMFVGLWPKTEIQAEKQATLPRHLERALDWLERHADEDISIEQLARLSGASIRTLQNSFRHHLSTTPNAYILQFRLARVHEELLYGSSDESIEKIAYRWGFGHMGYFAARYRAVYGKSPSETRRGRPDAQ